jgi:hypothetical protein
VSARCFLSVFAVGVGLCGLAACSSDDFDLTPTASTTSAGGAGGAGGATGSSTTTTGAQGGGGTTTTTSGGVGGAEPSGPTKLTIVNGVNDHEAIRVCFMPYPDGADVAPWPASQAGLAFAKAVVVDPPASIAPGDADIRPFVIGGDLTAIAGKSCSQALAIAAAGSEGAGGAGGGPPSPPPIVASAMPVIPASVLTSEKSLLLVFFGCLGGPGKTDPTQGLGCGFTYTPETPTASLTLVAMSRKKLPTSVALQLVHASAAMQPSDIRVTPGWEAATDVPVAKALALGGLGPKPPFVGLTRDNFGPLSKVALKTFAPNDIYAQSALFIQDAFVNGGIPDTQFQDGSSFTLVAIGGYPGAVSQSFWHPFTYTMVASDP